MTEQENLEPIDMELVESDPSIELIQNTLETFLEAASVEAVYAEPIQQNDTLIIPAAEVVSAMGFGVGSGYGSGPEEDVGGGSGGGGGGRVFSRPVAVIVASPDGVRIEPVIDLTKIALTGLTAGAFMVGMYMRLVSPKKALEDLQ